MGEVQTMDHTPASGALITPAEMIQQAIQRGSGVDVMERLLALQERYDANSARKAFDAAMTDLRSNLPKISKTREVDFPAKNGSGRTHYKFEDLAEIAESLAEPMAAAGLSFRWYTETVTGGVKVTCRITHRDGHFEETSLVGPVDNSGNKNPIQAIGSAVTYLQRYTLKAAVGVAASQDDDGRASGQRDDPPAPVDTSRAVFAGFESEVLAAANSAMLKAIWKRINAATLPDDLKGKLADAIDTRLAALKKAEVPAGYVPPTFDDDAFPGDRA